MCVFFAKVIFVKEENKKDGLAEGNFFKISTTWVESKRKKIKLNNLFQCKNEVAHTHTLQGIS